MIRFLPLIVKNCWRNRRRTVLTLVSIAVSMCLLGVMVAVFHAFYLRDPSPEEALRLVTRNRISLMMALPYSYAARIQRVPGVREVMISNWFGGTYKDNRDSRNNFARFAVEPEKLFTIYSELRVPEDWRRAFERERTACVIGRDLANRFNWRPGDHITLVGDIYPGQYELTVRGIFDSPRASDVLYFDKEYVEQTIPKGRRAFARMFDILIDSPKNASRIAEAVDAEFRNATAQTKTESEQGFVVGFVSLLGDIKMLLIGVSTAVMFTILLVSANAMSMSVRERVREVGVLKTLGFTPGDVLTLVLGEACAISVAGGTIGFLVSTLLTGGVSKTRAGLFLPPIKPFEPSVALACILMAGAIGLVSSLLPAMSASRASIVEALRSTD
jgi:putative ABC transport system permease protein